MMQTSYGSLTKSCCRKRQRIRNILTNMDTNYYSSYLKAYLIDVDVPLKDDDDFIDSRVEQASETFELQRRAGVPPACAQEMAMAVLMEGFE